MYNAGITRRGEGSENATLGGKRCLLSDPSPLRAHSITSTHSTKSTTIEMLFDDVVYSLSTAFRNLDGDYTIIV